MPRFARVSPGFSPGRARFARQAGRMNRSLLVKTVLMGALALVLMIPVGMIRDLVAERQARRNEAVTGIAEGWGKRQFPALHGSQTQAC